MCETLDLVNAARCDPELSSLHSRNATQTCLRPKSRTNLHVVRDCETVSIHSDFRPPRAHPFLLLALRRVTFALTRNRKSG